MICKKSETPPDGDSLFSHVYSRAAPPDAVKDLVIVCNSLLVNLPLLRLNPVPLCMRICSSVMKKDALSAACGTVSRSLAHNRLRHLRKTRAGTVRCMHDSTSGTPTLPENDVKTSAMRVTLKLGC